MSNECILSIIKKDSAQQFHPSKFCGSIFDILRFDFPWFCGSKNSTSVNNIEVITANSYELE